MDKLEELKIITENLENQMVIEPGMLYYAEDKSLSKGIIVGEQVSGIVSYVDETGKHGLILLLEQKELPWSRDLLSVKLPNGLSGKENTRLILKAAKKQGKTAEAAEWCADYAYDGVQAGEAFMMSQGEWDKTWSNIVAVNRSLRMCGKEELFQDIVYWTSSVFSRNNSRSWQDNIYAWGSHFNSGRGVNEFLMYKVKSCGVRAVLAF